MDRGRGEGSKHSDFIIRLERELCECCDGNGKVASSWMSGCDVFYVAYQCGVKEKRENILRNKLCSQYCFLQRKI